MYRHIYRINVIIGVNAQGGTRCWHVTLDRDGNDLRGYLDPFPKRRVVDLREGDCFTYKGQRETCHGIECFAQDVITDEEAQRRRNRSSDGWLVKCADDYIEPFNGMGSPFKSAAELGE